MIEGRNKLPQLTPEQRSRNLEAAKEARRRRAALRARMKSGELAPAAALDDPDALRMNVRQFLASVEGVGKRGAEVIAETLGIPENRRVRGLGPHQREAMLDMLEAWRGR